MVENNNPNGQSHASDWNDPLHLSGEGKRPVHLSEEDIQEIEAFASFCNELDYEFTPPQFLILNPKKVKAMEESVSAMKKLLDDERVGYRVEARNSFTKTDYLVDFVCGASVDVSPRNMVAYTQALLKTDGYGIGLSDSGDIVFTLEFGDVFVGR